MTTNLNLTAQLLMGAALLAGMFLARRKRFRAHAVCQTAVVLLNLIPIFLFMRPVFHRAVEPGLPAKLGEPFYGVATAHAALGTIAEALGLYVILVAGTNLLPKALRFKNYKRWMRLALALWWMTIGLGLCTYAVWYGGASSTGNAQPTNAQQSSNSQQSSGAARPEKAETTYAVEIGNFSFTPRELTVEAGATVVWKNKTGRHTVVADESGFESPLLGAGEEFRRTFEREGSYPYYCSLHGDKGGKEMAGVIHVVPRRP